MRENLLRSVPFEVVRADEDEDGDGDGLSLQGYAAVFDTPTEIDSWEGRFVERVRRGAFRKSIRERTPVLQFEHGRHPLLGSMPIGRIDELREDDKGLFVSARLSENWLIEPVRDAIRDGAVDGMSFRFTVIRDQWRDATGKPVKPEELPGLLWDAGDRGPLECTLIEVRCPELGPVVFPAYEATSVDVRARSVAELIRGDGELRREVRAGLAREAPPAAVDDLEDPAVRRDVARALLFGEHDTQASDAPPDGHPSVPQDRSTGAPADEGHPPEHDDAPPPDGHPSTNPTSQALRSEISERLAFMRAHLASIADKDA